MCLTECCVFSLAHNNYVTPSDFIPAKGQLYYISILTDEFGLICSESQPIMDMPDIARIKLEIYALNYSNADTTLIRLFGKPRAIQPSFYVYNNQLKITNIVERYLWYYKSNLYTYTDRDFIEFLRPSFFINLNDGVNNLISPLDTIYRHTYILDQITSDSTIVYNDATLNVIDRIDSMLVQSFTFSADMINFFSCVNEYLENRMEPFSVLTTFIPSNISNGVGFWGSVYISERKIKIPDTKKGNFNYEF